MKKISTAKQGNWRLMVIVSSGRSLSSTDSDADETSDEDNEDTNDEIGTTTGRWGQWRWARKS